MRICAGAWLNASPCIDLTIRNVVDNPAEVGKQFGKFSAALTMAGELELGTQQRRLVGDERGPISVEQFRWGKFSVPLGQFRFIVEEFEMARPAGHEKIDHPLGLGGKVGELRREGLRGRRMRRIWHAEKFGEPR